MRLRIDPDDGQSAASWWRRLSPFEWAALGVVALAFVLRWVEFWKLPGINGDEAWYGVQALRVSSDTPVDWRTPTGNFLSPAQMAPMWLLLKVFDPQPWLLRFPAQVAGALAVPAVGWAAWRALGRTAAFATAALCAALPVNMAYARFGWDPSHVGLWLALASVAAVTRRPLAMGILFALSVWVHPTAVLAAPFLGCTYAGAALSRGGRWRLVASIASGAVALGAGAAVLKLTTRGTRATVTLKDVASRVGSGEAWLSHLDGIGRFFTGDTIYTYITGVGLPGPGALWAALFWGGCAVLFGFGLRGLWRARSPVAWGMVAGALLTHAAFFAAAGPKGLSPGVERFAMVLVVPSLLAAAALAFHSASSASFAWPRRTALALSAAMVVSFAVCYLGELHRTGSAGHPTFWTGAIEPKVLAVRRILQERDPNRRTVILSPGWWTSWLAAYLTFRVPNVEVSPRVMQANALGADVDVFLFDFLGGQAERVVKFYPSRFDRRDVPGFARPAVVAVWHRR